MEIRDVVSQPVELPPPCGGHAKGVPLMSVVGLVQGSEKAVLMAM